jgi:acyl-CoA synthetase (AMP-forming)/AMP-acid ligase II
LRLNRSTQLLQQGKGPAGTQKRSENPSTPQVLLERAPKDYPTVPPPLRFIRSCSSSLAPATMQALEDTFKVCAAAVDWLRLTDRRFDQLLDRPSGGQAAGALERRGAKQRAGRVAVLTAARADPPHPPSPRQTQVPVLEAYAMTEASHQMTSNPLPKHGARKPGSVGKAQGGVSVAILDDAGKPVPQGEVGEVCIKGANVTKG